MTSANQGRRTLLFIHGIRNDDPAGSWLVGLDAALRREGTSAVAERGYDVVAPSYLAELEATEVPPTPAPRTTYRKASEEQRVAAAARYWSDLADLERAGLRDVDIKPGVLTGVSPDAPAAAAVRARFADAARYAAEEDRRSLVLTRLLAAIPDSGDLVILAHSLGSVVAVDLLYRLPETVRLRMLVTLGSPLAIRALHRHLERRGRDFPFEVLGPWLNVAGKGDFVTAFRGLSPLFPEASDAFVDTGSKPGAAHSVRSYFEQPVVARALEWLDQRDRRQTRSEDELLPEARLSPVALAIAIGAQYALRLEQEQKPGDTRRRFAEARRLSAEDAAAKLSEAGERHPVLTRDNAKLLDGRPSPDGTVHALLTAWMLNPIAPFEVELKREVRASALDRLANDLGVPVEWARTVTEAEQSARSAHKEARSTWTRAAMAAAGVAAVIAAPVAVIVAAPAGLAGGAALVAGLAALGPGGMIGGLGIVGLLGGAGGALTTRALIAGTAAEVEETIIQIQAFARATTRLRCALPGKPEWFVLVAMENQLSDDLARLSRFSEKDAPGLKEIQRKLRSVRRALEWLESEGLAPGGLPAGGDLA